MFTPTENRARRAQPSMVVRDRQSCNRGNGKPFPVFQFPSFGNQPTQAPWAPLPKRQRLENDLNDVQRALFESSISEQAPGAPYKRRAGGIDNRFLRMVKRRLVLGVQAPGAPIAAEKQAVAQEASVIEDVRARLFF